MSRLATIPHAPIERVSHKTGTVETLEVGSFVNLVASEGIYAAEGEPTVVVQLTDFDWRFTVPSPAAAVEWARKLNTIARR